MQFWIYAPNADSAFIGSFSCRFSGERKNGKNFGFGQVLEPRAID